MDDMESLPAPPTKDERLWAMICHLIAYAGHVFPFGNVIGPVVIWALKKDTSAFIDDQGKESINCQISVSIYLLVAGALCWVLVGFLLFPVIYLAAVILVLIAAVKANDGIRYRYPLIIRFIK